jgi:hypothetical protein
MKKIVGALIVVLTIFLLVSNTKSPGFDDKVSELTSYCRSYGYNCSYGILVDYSRSILSRRLYLVDLKTGDVVIRSLCGHGYGGIGTILKGDLSNVPGSHCSSLGHYRIGKKRKMYTQDFMAFELDGLDSTNSNARSRSILLHESPWLLSYGCVTLLPGRFAKVAQILQSQPKNVIMWVYDDTIS